MKENTIIYKATQELLNKIAKREEIGIKGTAKVKGSGDYWQKVYRRDRNI